MRKNKYFLKDHLSYDYYLNMQMESKYPKMNKQKKKVLVLCIVLLIGILKLTSVNILSPLSSFSRLFIMDDDGNKIGNYHGPSNKIKVQGLVFNPAFNLLGTTNSKNIPCHFSYSSRVICHLLQNSSLLFGNQQNIAKEEAECRIITEMKVYLCLSKSLST